MGNVRFVIPTFDLKPWLGFATSVILVLMGEDVSSVVALVLVMLTIVPSAHGWKKIEMDVLRSSI